jgi:acetyl esterase/lipase
LERLARFQTKLLQRGPAPQAFHNDVPPAGVREVTYQSDGLALKAWVATPQTPGGSKLPGVVYLHGGFAFGAEDFRDATPFLNAGLVLMCPMLRGENGNPGNYEMFLGEVRDAQAAVAWLAQQPNIEPSRIYAFGHSSGGVISALLSLHDAGIRHSGSAGGLYGPKLFDWMKSDLPFPLDDPNERTFRVLVGNISAMRHRHYAFVGASDPGQAVAAAKSERAQKDLLAITSVEGNHFTSLGPAINAYIKTIEENP